MPRGGPMLHYLIHVRFIFWQSLEATISHSDPNNKLCAEIYKATVKMRQWQGDSEVAECPHCHVSFSFLLRKHHCRLCGSVVCASCSKHSSPLPTYGFCKHVRICDKCVFKCIFSEMGGVDRSRKLLATPFYKFQTAKKCRRFGLGLINLLL